MCRPAFYGLGVFVSYKQLRLSLLIMNKKKNPQTENRLRVDPPRDNASCKIVGRSKYSFPCFSFLYFTYSVTISIIRGHILIEF